MTVYEYLKNRRKISIVHLNSCEQFFLLILRYQIESALIEIGNF